MVKKYNKVFVTGDLHLGDVTFRHEEKLVDALKQERFDCLVFGGDTFDLWRGKSIEGLVAKYDRLFKFLQSLKVKVVFIKGNHDRQIDFLRRLNFSVKSKFRFIDSVGKRVKVIHGDQFDLACKRYEFLLKKVIWFEEKINSLLTKMDNQYAIRMGKLLGNLDLRNAVDGFYRKIIFYRNVDALLFGHIHVPWEGKEGKVDFYNWGGWQNDLGLNPRYLHCDQGKIKSIEVK